MTTQHSHRWSSGLFGALGALLIAAWSGAAAASQTYPAEVLEALGTKCPLPCTVCHTTPTGGIGQLTKFGENLKLQGPLPPSSPDLVAPALASLAQADTDGDGTNDIDELLDDQNPNIVGDAPYCVLTYGCGARVEPRGELRVEAALAGALVTAGLFWAGRRRRR